ncbi:MAG: hypothetical protein RIQ99_1866 [Pseudomonadota bacterium]
MKWIIAYCVAAVAFGVVDALWLRWAGPNLYRPALGDLLAPQFRLAPAMAFYALYLGGIVWFAVRPALAAADPTALLAGVPLAVLNGALLGMIAYATYDLTNQATLRHWSGQITLIDIAWGASATALASGIAAIAAQRFAS